MHTGKGDSVSMADFSRAMGVALQRLRLERGLSQERLAHMAGIASYTYQKFEKGESKPGTPMNPRLFTLLALAEVLEVTLEDIVPADWPDLTEGR
ncbi:MAG: family transcriptional regulator [Rhodoglobus sp.]|nr:family transcriptional regulator [Rhodoglobus sp.]